MTDKPIIKRCGCAANIVIRRSVFAPFRGFAPAAGKGGKSGKPRNASGIYGGYWARLGHKIYLVQTLFAGDKIALDV